MKTNNRGITLTELLIATILVGIVMAGAVSVDYAVRRSRQNVVDTGRIASQLDYAMLQMSRDAMATTGDAGSESRNGIAWDSTPNIYNICFRYDFDSNPNNYDGDRWTCYSQTVAQKIILRCSMLTDKLGPEAACPAGSEQILQLNQNSPLGPFFIVNPTIEGGVKDITFSLETCSDPTQAENPITNPCLTLHSTVNLPSLSR